MFEEISNKDVLDLYVFHNPDSVVARLVKIIGLANVCTILESDSFKNKAIYLPQVSSLQRGIKPLIIRKRLKGLVNKEREEMIQQLSRFFNVSKKKIEKMNETGKYCR